MPKVLICYVKKIMWVFLFYCTDINENRAHVHVGKKGSQDLCKIWLEPTVKVEKSGEFTDAQIKEIVALTIANKDRLLAQWHLFRAGKTVKIIKITK